MHMARKDRSFSTADIIRLWCFNLTDEEQNEVLLFFWLIVPGILLDNTRIESIIRIIQEIVSNRLLRLILAVLERYLSLIRRILNRWWVEIIIKNEKIKKEVIKCIIERTK